MGRRFAESISIKKPRMGMVNIDETNGSEMRRQFFWTRAGEARSRRIALWRGDRFGGGMERRYRADAGRLSPGGFGGISITSVLC
jgi:hypothetical protein